MLLTRMAICVIDIPPKNAIAERCALWIDNTTVHQM